MKPTERLIRPGIIPRIRPVPKPRPEQKRSVDEQRYRRRNEIEEALERTEKYQASGEIQAAADGVVEKLKSMGTGNPEPGKPGTIAVRAIGAPDPKSGLLVPLSGIRFHLLVGRGKVDQAMADSTGLAYLTLPRPKDVKDERIAYEIHVIAGDGSVVGRNPGACTIKESPVHLIELGPSDPVAPYLARGIKWNNAIQAAEHARDEIQEAVTKALDRQAEELRKVLERVDKTFDRDRIPIRPGKIPITEIPIKPEKPYEKPIQEKPIRQTPTEEMPEKPVKQKPPTEKPVDETPKKSEKPRKPKKSEKDKSKKPAKPKKSTKPRRQTKTKKGKKEEGDK